MTVEECYKKWLLNKISFCRLASLVAWWLCEDSCCSFITRSVSSFVQVESVGTMDVMFQPIPSVVYLQNYEPLKTYQVPLLMRNLDVVLSSCLLCFQLAVHQRGLCAVTQNHCAVSHTVDIICLCSVFWHW